MASIIDHHAEFRPTDRRARDLPHANPGFYLGLAELLAEISLPYSGRVFSGGDMMEGMCKCGGRIKESNHKVTTDTGANRWLEPMTRYLLPINIETSKCDSCGRRRVVATDSYNVIVMERG